MQSALTCFAIGTALGTASIAVAKSPTTTFNEGYYLYINDASQIPLTGLKPSSPTATQVSTDENSTQMPVFEGRPKAKSASLPSFGPWIAGALSRVEVLKKTLHDQVEPENYSNATRAIRDAETILLKLALAGLSKRPAIGWDSEGAVSFNVRAADFSADFTAYGDGKYSFAARLSRQPPISDELDIGDPLPKTLTALFG